MKTIFKTFTPLFLLLIFVVSCGPPPPPGLEEFYYAENGSPTMILLDIPDASTNAKKITGKSTSTSAVIDIKLNSIAIGTYIIGSGSGNEFVYKKPTVTNVWTGTSGTITITMNSGWFLAGTFDISAGTGIPSVNLIKGNFSNVEINP